jgi:hypothetical protein
LVLDWVTSTLIGSSWRIVVSTSVLVGGHQGAGRQRGFVDPPADRGGDLGVVEIDARRGDAGLGRGDIGIGLGQRRIGIVEVLLADGVALTGSR